MKLFLKSTKKVYRPVEDLVVPALLVAVIQVTQVVVGIQGDPAAPVVEEAVVVSWKNSGISHIIIIRLEKVFRQYTNRFGGIFGGPINMDFR